MSWIYEPSLTQPTLGLAAATCDAPSPGSGYRVYAVGGDDGNSMVAAAAAYDTQAKSWLPVAAMTTPRAYLAAAASPGRLHCLGGLGASGVLNTHEIYDPVMDSWGMAAPLPTARLSLAAVTGSNGLVYVLGGQTGSEVVATVEAYDPASEQWVSPAPEPMPTPRTRLAAVTGHDGLIYAIGGDGSAVTLPGGATAAVPLDTVEVYSPSTNSWTTGPSLPAPRWGLAAAVGPDGLIYAIGGFDAASGDIAAQTTVYSYNPADPAAGWALQAPLLTGQAFLAADTGPDGLIYAIGGGNYSPTGSIGSPSGSVEAFAVAAPLAAPDPYIGNGSYQSPQIILVGSNSDPVLITGEPGAWDTEVQYEASYQIQALVYNDSSVAATNTTVRFWHFAGEAGSVGTLIDTQTVTVPANGSVLVTSASPFESGPAGQQECVAVSVANLKSPYFSVDPTTAAQVIDPTVAHPPGSGHYGSAWRHTTSVATLAPSPVYCQNLLATLEQALEEGAPKLTVSMAKSIAQELETCHLRGYLNEGQYQQGVGALNNINKEPITPPKEQPRAGPGAI